MENLLEPGTALNMVDKLEKTIISLAQLPKRSVIRRIEAYVNGNYRRLCAGFSADTP